MIIPSLRALNTKESRVINCPRLMQILENFQTADRFPLFSLYRTVRVTTSAADAAAV